MKKHGTDGKRRVWRKLHFAVDTDTHEIIVVELILSGVTDVEVLPNLLKQTHRSIKEISGDCIYDTRECHRVKSEHLKQLLGVSLTLRNYNAQVRETHAIIKALNKLTGISMPKLNMSFKIKQLI